MYIWRYIESRATEIGSENPTLLGVYALEVSGYRYLIWKLTLSGGLHSGGLENLGLSVLDLDLLELGLGLGVYTLGVYTLGV